MLSASESAGDLAAARTERREREMRLLLASDYGVIIKDLKFEYVDKARQTGIEQLGMSKVFFKDGFDTGLFVLGSYRNEHTGEYRWEDILYASFWTEIPKKSIFKSRNGRLVKKRLKLKSAIEMLDRAVERHEEYLASLPPIPEDPAIKPSASAKESALTALRLVKDFIKAPHTKA